MPVGNVKQTGAPKTSLQNIAATEPMAGKGRGAEAIKELPKVTPSSAASILKRAPTKQPLTQQLLSLLYRKVKTRR